MKIHGANIHCSICNAQPYPDSPEIRETFDLLKIDGDCFCELHRPEEKAGAQRVASTAPVAALGVFETMIKDQFATLAEAIDDKDEASLQALEVVEEEIARGLEALKRAV